MRLVVVIMLAVSPLGGRFASDTGRRYVVAVRR